MTEYTPQLIKTIGEHGEEVLMKLQEIVTVEDKDYALMSIVDDDKLPDTNDIEDEVVIMKMIKTDDEISFEIIEDDDEFEMVQSAIMEDGEEED